MTLNELEPPSNCSVQADSRKINPNFYQQPYGFVS